MIMQLILMSNKVLSKLKGLIVENACLGKIFTPATSGCVPAKLIAREYKIKKPQNKMHFCVSGSSFASADLLKFTNYSSYILAHSLKNCNRFSDNKSLSSLDSFGTPINMQIKSRDRTEKEQ